MDIFWEDSFRYRSDVGVKIKICGEKLFQLELGKTTSRFLELVLMGIHFFAQHL